MTGPSTQDSPKVPEKWAPQELVRLRSGCVPTTPAEGDSLRGLEAETYIPVSAFLSDATVEVLAQRLYEEHGVERPQERRWSATVEAVREMYRQDARAHLQAVAEQVGGGQG